MGVCRKYLIQILICPKGESRDACHVAKCLVLALRSSFKKLLIIGTIETVPVLLPRYLSAWLAVAQMITRYLLNYLDVNQIFVCWMLDVGCSDGLSVEFYNSLGIAAEGVDPSREAIDIGNNRGLVLHEGYLQDIGFADNSFDVLTMYEVIEHLPDPVAMLMECRRILKPGGVLLIGTGNADSWTRHFKKEKWDFFGLYGRGGHISFFSPKSLSILGEKTGFRLGHVRTYTVKFYEKSEVSWPVYRSAKFASECLSFLARRLNKGHQMEVCLVAV